MSHSKSMCHSRSAAGVQIGTRFALRTRRFANGITFVGLMMLAGINPCAAGALTLDVLDQAGHGVADVVVTATPVGPATTSTPGTAVMDQHNLAFVPRILVVATGSSVEFPNSDSVSHQVYSFSAAKRFQLPLYKGARHPPVTFERAGLVVLGCNIHDEMVGYIYVTDAPHFGKTDASGSLRVRDLPAGDYKVTVWSPLIADPAPALVRNVHVDAHDSAAERVQLTRPLRARPEPRPRRQDWEY